MNQVLKRYCQAWRMWNSWLKACERPEIEIEQFIESGFKLIGHSLEADHDNVIGRDGDYDIIITNQNIHVSFKGKARYTWWPFVISYGNLKPHDCTLHCLTPPLLNVQSNEDTCYQ